MFDVLAYPIVFVAGAVMLLVRRLGIARLPACRTAFLQLGVFPIRDQWGEPLFHPRHLVRPLAHPRPLAGIDLDASGQLTRLEQFRYQDELRAICTEAPRPNAYVFDNATFAAGDAECLYSLIRLHRPASIIEIGGGGNSTLMMLRAIAENRREDPEYRCRLVCIEPYRAPWLESLGVEVIRERVELVDRAIFAQLQANDILFIDSSHIIRPQGDVVTEWLEIVPTVAPGVLVHVHDIFTPRDVKEEWLVRHVCFMNEQYLLEAFLSFNRDFRVLLALNFLKHEHWDAIAHAFPVLADSPAHEPGSLWMVREG